MAKLYKSISIEQDLHDRLIIQAKQYSEKVGVKVSINNLINKLLTDWEKENA